MQVSSPPSVTPNICMFNLWVPNEDIGRRCPVTSDRLALHAERSSLCLDETPHSRYPAPLPGIEEGEHLTILHYTRLISMSFGDASSIFGLYRSFDVISSSFCWQRFMWYSIGLFRVSCRSHYSVGSLPSIDHRLLRDRKQMQSVQGCSARPNRYFSIAKPGDPASYRVARDSRYACYRESDTVTGTISEGGSSINIMTRMARSKFVIFLA